MTDKILKDTIAFNFIGIMTYAPAYVAIMILQVELFTPTFISVLATVTAIFQLTVKHMAKISFEKKLFLPMYLEILHLPILIPLLIYYPSAGLIFMIIADVFIENAYFNRSGIITEKLKK